MNTTLWITTWLLVLSGSGSLLNAAPAQLLTMRNSSVPLPAGGNDDSVAPSMSPDGRFVVFASAANNLVPADNNRPGFDVFLRDRASNTTALVSINSSNTGGGNDHSMLGQVSTNGQFVVFQSEASDLVANDTNKFSDIFVRDLVAGTTRLVSVAITGGAANGVSSDPVLTPDGRYVAFISSATNLVVGDTNKIPDVFVRDLNTDTTSLVSVGAVLPSGSTTATMSMPAITPDGRYVTFFSTAQGLAAGTPSAPKGEVYVRDLVANQTTWASTNAAAIALTALGLSGPMSYHPALSDNGRYVAFKSGSINASGVTVILHYDSTAATTTIISTNGLPAMLDQDDPFGPEMTPDGRYIVFVQREGAVGSGYSSVHRWDSQTTADTLVSDSGSGVPTNTFSRKPVISRDGRFVVFLSSATNLVGNALGGGFHIYLRDLQLGTTQLVDVDPNGVGSTDDELASLSLSADGRFVAFSSPDGKLVNLDQNHAYDIFVRDLTGAVSELISIRDATVVPQTGDGYSSLSQFSVSANGRSVVFASRADDLVANDTNGVQDIFVQDLTTGTNILVTVANDGGPAGVGLSASPVVNASGRFVAFVSTAPNLITGQVNTNANVFLRDLHAGTTILVSASTNGVSPGDGDSFDPVISRDGRYVAFMSSARNLAAGVTEGINTFWRDTQGGATVALKGPTYYIYPPSLSSDGRYVAYSGISGAQVQLRVRDNQLGTDIYTNTGVVTAAALSPTGTRLLYKISGTVFVDNVIARTNVLSFTSPVAAWSSAGWSADGRFIAYVAGTNNASGTNIYLCDLQTRTTTIICTNYSPIGAGSGASDSPVVSADGRFVVYRSFATNIVSGNTKPAPNLFLFDRVAGTNTLLTAGQVGSSPILWDSKPAISANGGTVAFLGLGSGLVSGDLNRVQDAFGFTLNAGTPLDTDGDGIPDWWMAQYFGHVTAQAGDSSLAQDDADGDRMTNWQEWIAGTDPRDPLSGLRMLNPVRINSGLTLIWQSVSGVTYYLQRSGNLESQPAFSTIQSNIVGQAVTTFYTDTNIMNPGPDFYRVGVQQ